MPKQTISHCPLSGRELRELRKTLGLNQTQFWQPVGVTQTAGCRYESGRNIPKPVWELIRIVYIERVDLSEIKECDIRAAAYIKEHYSDLYASVCAAIEQD